MPYKLCCTHSYPLVPRELHGNKDRYQPETTSEGCTRTIPIKATLSGNGFLSRKTLRTSRDAGPDGFHYGTCCCPERIARQRRQVLPRNYSDRVQKKHIYRGHPLGQRLFKQETSGDLSGRRTRQIFGESNVIFRPYTDRFPGYDVRFRACQTINLVNKFAYPVTNHTCVYGQLTRSTPVSTYTNLVSTQSSRK